MMPNRISFVSYNLWNTQRWPERRPALEKFLTLYKPDILCLQELRPETMLVIDETLETHERVIDDSSRWSYQSNIYWHSDYFDKVAHGLESLQVLDNRPAFFWVRLKLKGSEQTLFVSTAHFTWQGDPKEKETGLTSRNKQAKLTVAYLKNLVLTGEPAFFLGDLNDPVIPQLFFPDAGFHSCFQALNQLCPPTFPSLPTTSDVSENQAIDWILANDYSRPIIAAVPHLYANGISPSDHWPVYAIYQI